MQPLIQTSDIYFTGFTKTIRPSVKATVTTENLYKLFVNLNLDGSERSEDCVKLTC